MNEKRTCPVCNNAGNKFGSVINYDKRIGKHHVYIEKCNDCDFTFQSPLLDKKLRDRIYSESFIGNKDKQEKYLLSMKRRRNGLAKLFCGFVDENSKVVEIGCSSGFILNDMNNIRKAKYFGFDLDVDAIKFGQEKFKNIKLSTENFFEKDDIFDTIVLSHVLEHIDSPISFINGLKNRVSDNGKIIISVPNSKKELERPSWEHVNYFSAKALTNLAHKCNLSILFLKEWTTPNNEQELTIVLSKIKQPDAKLIDESSDWAVRRSVRIAIRAWYDATESKDKNQLNWLRKEYSKNKKGRKLSEWLLWSKFYRFFNIKK